MTWLAALCLSVPLAAALVWCTRFAARSAGASRRAARREQAKATRAVGVMAASALARLTREMLEFQKKAAEQATIDRNNNFVNGHRNAEARVTFLRDAVDRGARSIEGLSDAIRYAARRNADATKYAARAMRPDLLRAKAPKSENPDPVEWTEWERQHPDFDENERLHLRWAFDVLRGVEKVSEEKRQVAMIVYGEGQVAYGLPQLDLRAAVLTQASGSES